jgi:tRNA pseudouridine65 synthase
MDSPLIPILHQDDELIVINKPSGLMVHRGWGADAPSLVQILRDQLSVDRLHVIHRLDRSTSGVMILALNAAAAAALSAAFRERQVKKSYLALVRGSFRFSGRLDHPIPKAPGEQRVEAQTSFHCLAQADTKPRETSLVLAHPQTGRTHQIRRHLKHLNHPIIGDVNYGKGPLNKAARSTYKLSRLALHAWRIKLTHPMSGASMSWTANLPDSLSLPLERMGYPLDQLEAHARRLDAAHT